MANLFIDVASYQPDNYDYFRSLKNQGVKASVVKLTEATNYVNPKANAQIQSAKSVGMLYHGYHYLHAQNTAQATAEANFFVQTAKTLGLDSSCVMVCDVEDPSLTSDKGLLTEIVNTFLNTVKNSGFPKVDVYASTSWFRSRLNKDNLACSNHWVASYGTSNAGITCGSWQFTDKFNNQNLDCSEDYNGFYTESQTSQAPKPTQVKLEDLTLSVPFRAKGACWISNPDGAIVYKDTELKEPTAQVVPFGSAWQIYGSGDGGVYSIGGYISQSDAVVKFSRGMGMGDYTGMTTIITTDDCYTQTIPEAGQAGVTHLEKGGAYRINRQSEDFKFVDLGLNQWVDTSKLNVVL